MATARLNDAGSMQAHSACPVEPVPPCEQPQCFDRRLRSIPIDEGSLLLGNLSDACMVSKFNAASIGPNTRTGDVMPLLAV